MVSFFKDLDVSICFSGSGFTDKVFFFYFISFKVKGIQSTTQIWAAFRMAHNLFDEGEEIFDFWTKYIIKPLNDWEAKAAEKKCSMHNIQFPMFISNILNDPETSGLSIES